MSEPRDSKSLLIGIPKGSLQESTLALFSRAGYRFYGSERSLWLTSNDPEVRPVLLRPQEIPLYVAEGRLDCGLAGWDWILENNSNGAVKMLADLCYSKRSFRPVRWVLAVAENSDYQETDDLKKQAPPVRISTELQQVTETWLSERGIYADVQFSWGATEAKVPFFCDAIVECTETGSSLRANGLRILDTVLESTTRFFANSEVYKTDEWKRNKLEGIALLLKSCLAAETKNSLHLRAAKDKAETLKALIPSSAIVTTWEGEAGMVVFDIVIDKDALRDLVPLLVRNGGENICVIPPAMLYR